MNASIIDGRAISQSIKNQLKCEIKLQPQKPTLAVILVGEDPASAIYVQRKQEACAEVGIHSVFHHLDNRVTTQNLLNLIESCNKDGAVHGILLQLPLPSHIDAHALLEAICPKKDVDGFHPLNLGRLAQKRPLLRPCTPWGVMKLIQSTGKDITGLNATVIGASNIVGRPMALELLLAHCSVSIVHRLSQDLHSSITSADILISATGQRNVFPTSWIKPGAIVIDVGIHRQDNGKLVGDIDFKKASERAAFITPVPGGVGPMTVACLLLNTWHAFQMQQE